jgi:hypothetical protein
MPSSLSPKFGRKSTLIICLALAAAGAVRGIAQTSDQQHQEQQEERKQQQEQQRLQQQRIERLPEAVRNNPHALAHLGENHFGLNTEETFRKPAIYGTLVQPAEVPTGVEFTVRNPAFVTGVPSTLFGLQAQDANLQTAVTAGLNCVAWYPYANRTEIFNKCPNTTLNVSVVHSDGTFDSPNYVVQQGWVRNDGTDGGNLILGPGVIEVRGCQWPFRPMFDQDGGGGCTL